MPNVGTLAGLRLDGLHFGVEGGASGAACGMTKRRPRLLTLPTPLDSILTGLCTSAGTSAGYSHGDAGYSHILPNVTNPSPHFEAWEPLTGDVVTLSIGLTWIVPRVTRCQKIPAPLKLLRLSKSTPSHLPLLHELLCIQPFSKLSSPMLPSPLRILL